MINKRRYKIPLYIRYILIRIIPCFFILIFLFPSFCFSQRPLKDLISFIHTPQQLAKWLSNEFVWQWEMNDKWQSPQELIDSKIGDCEDFASLASTVLKHLGISNDIIIIKFEDLKLKHAVCIWKEEDGFYSFISNQELFRTKERTIKEAVEKFYPDCERIIFANKEISKI